MPAPTPPSSLSLASSINFANVPSNIAVTPDRINELNAKAGTAGAAFAARIASLQETFAQARDNYSRQGEELVRASAKEDESLMRQIARKNAATQIAKYKRGLIESSAADRAAMLKQLKSYSDEAASLELVFVGPSQMLGRVALGDPRKTQLVQQLTGAGPSEMESAALTAIYANDLVLASAVLLVVDRQQRDRRPFSPTAFAQRVMGDQFKDVSTKLQSVQSAYRSAAEADRVFISTTGINSVASIAQAIANGDLEAHVQSARGPASVARPS